ncbi:MAG: hypothetical protein AB7F43_06145 [Bacteriovoracia bacterium]
MKFKPKAIGLFVLICLFSVNGFCIQSEPLDPVRISEMTIDERLGEIEARVHLLKRIKSDLDNETKEVSKGATYTITNLGKWATGVIAAVDLVNFSVALTGLLEAKARSDFRIDYQKYAVQSFALNTIIFTSISLALSCLEGTSERSVPMTDQDKARFRDAIAVISREIELLKTTQR